MVYEKNCNPSVYMCVHVREHNNLQMVVSVELLFGKYILNHCRKDFMYFRTNQQIRKFLNHFTTNSIDMTTKEM